MSVIAREQSARPRPRTKPSPNAIAAFPNALLNLGFFVYTVCCIAPVVLILMGSLTNEAVLHHDGFSFIPKQFSTLAYQYIFSDFGQVLHSYGVSIFITVVGSLASVLLTAMFAYPLSRSDFRYRGFFAFVVIIPLLFNGGLVPWYMVYSSLLHLKDTLLVLILPLLIAPFNVIIMRTFFSSSVPVSIIESAKMDGAGEFQIFFRMVLPLSTPVLATVGLFQSLAYWNDWFNALMFMTNDSILPLQYLLYRVQSTLQVLTNLNASGQGGTSATDLPDLTARMALCVVTIGPVILAYPFLQRFFVKGLTVGAIKG